MVDTSFDQRYFRFKKGPIEASWDVIFPGDSVSFSTVLEPNYQLTSFNVSSAIIKYYVEKDDIQKVFFLLD